MSVLAPVLSAFVSVGFAGPAGKAAPPTSYTLDPAHSQIGFDLRSSLTDFHGAASQMSGALSLVGKEGVTGRLEVPVAGLSTGLGVRDARLQGYALDNTRHPTITFDVSGASDLALLAAKSGSGAVDLTGTLTVRGQSRPVTVRTTATWKDGALALKGAVPLRWSDFGVPDPSPAFTTLFPTVDVHFDVQLRPAS